MTRGSVACIVVSWTILLGCVPSQITTVIVYDGPDAFVRLETDRTVDQNRGHSHPVDLSPEQMAAVLGGLVFEEPWAKLPFYDDLSQPRRHPALTESEIVLFAPLLVAALAKATPEEIITFYRSTTRSGTQRHVTSGGLFVDRDDLHILLANYRSLTHYNADSGVADTTDDRLTPLRALAPQRGRFGFEPLEAVGETTGSGISAWFQPDRREVIVRYKRVPPRRLSLPPGTAVPHP